MFLGLALFVSPALAENDEGSSAVLIVRACEACEDGSTCGSSGICANGDVCRAATCADGSTCGAGGAGKCANLSACKRTRFGARCTADGRGDECSAAAACRIDAVYFGSRSKCVFSLDPHEAYCREQSGSTWSYRAASWAECGRDSIPGYEVDVCDNPNSDGDNKCYYCLGAPSVCSDGSRCGSGGAGLCTNGTRCLHSFCEDGSVCGSGGTGLCTSGEACDCVTSECPTGVCGAGGPGLCSDGTTPCFRPKTDRARWRYATGNLVVASPILATCDPDSDLYRDQSQLDPAVPDRNPGLDPKPVGNDCLYVGAKDNYFYALDEESLLPHPSPTPPAGGFAGPPRGGCLWRFDTEGLVHSKAAADPYQDKVYIGSFGRKLWRYRRYPIVAQPTPAACGATDPYACQQTIGQLEDGWPLSLSVDIDGDALVPRVSGTPLPDRLLVGTAPRPQPTPSTVLGMTLNYTGPPKPTPLHFLRSGGDRSFTRGLVQARNGVFYSGNGETASETGLMAFTLKAPDNIELLSKGELDKTTEAYSGALAPASCDENGVGGVDYGGLQWHRTTPVLNQDQDYLFVGNRAVTNGDLRKRIQAFKAVDPNYASTNLKSDSLLACYKSGTSPTGFTAPLAYARVPCSGCCGTETSVDRLFVGDRANAFHAVNFCPLLGNDAFSEAYRVGSLHQFRAQAAVALELGTVFAYDESDNKEHFYAFDINTGDMKWEYWVGDPDYGANAACQSANTPAGGVNCFPAPVPYVIDIRPTFPHTPYVVSSSGCWNQSQIILGVGTYQMPEAPIPDFAGTTIEPGATYFRTAAGVKIFNLTTGEQMKYPCYYICGGNVNLAPGWNEIVVTTADFAGKEGNTRIRVNYQTTCT